MEKSAAIERIWEIWEEMQKLSEEAEKLGKEHGFEIEPYSFPFPSV